MELALAKPGKDTGNEKISISDDAFGRDFNEPLVHQTVVTFLAGSRQGSVKQKNRSEVRGGGRKPWRQNEFVDQAHVISSETKSKYEVFA